MRASDRLGRATWVLAVGALLSGPAAVGAQERFPDPPPGHGMYSDAVRAGDLVFVAGVASGHPDPLTPFRQVFERIGETLGGEGHPAVDGGV